MFGPKRLLNYFKSERREIRSVAKIYLKSFLASRSAFVSSRLVVSRSNLMSDSFARLTFPARSEAFLAQPERDAEIIMQAANTYDMIRQFYCAQCRECRARCVLSIMRCILLPCRTEKKTSPRRKTRRDHREETKTFLSRLLLTVLRLLSAQRIYLFAKFSALKSCLEFVTTSSRDSARF